MCWETRFYEDVELEVLDDEDESLDELDDFDSLEGLVDELAALDDALDDALDEELDLLSVL